MDQLEQGMTDLVALIDRYGKEIQAISEEALQGGGKRPGGDLRGKVTEVQDRIHRQAMELYDRLVGAGAEIERELVTKLNEIKETMGRAAVLKEIITSTVKPAGQ